MEPLEQLQTKYNTLAVQYSKLRSQVPVLKKAFTEEQNKNSILCEEIKSKDQQLRISESEADSLHFRNQQLLCRVNVLQEELEAYQNGLQKDSKSKSLDGPQFLHSSDQELGQQLAENAALIFTLNEYKERHELEVKALRDEIESLKLESNVQNNHLNENSQTLPKCSSEVGVKNQRSTITETIQKALEKQLFETQHSLQEVMVERDRLKQKLKLHEENIKNGFYDLGSDDCESDINETSNLTSCLEQSQDSLISQSENESENFSHKEAVARENAIKQCFKLRCEKLISEKMVFKSKVATFEEECINLKSRLENEVVKRMALEELLEKEKEASTNTKEELSTTTANYEIQLSTMSDHLAGLNDIIQEQKGQLDSLHTELNKPHKGKK